jgi:hypothetical protein
MSALIKLLTESEETPEFSDFYTRHEDTPHKQFVDFLESLGFKLIFNSRENNPQQTETYELLVNNAAWEGLYNSEIYTVDILYDATTGLTISVVFNLCLHYTIKTSYVALSIFRKKFYTKDIIESLTLLEKFKELIEKSIKIAEYLRPTKDIYKLSTSLMDAAVKIFGED